MERALEALIGAGEVLVLSKRYDPVSFPGIAVTEE
jgi:hypothetical protein